jgi:triacylglycerol lipase
MISEGGLELPSTTLKGKYGIGAAKVDSHGGLFILGKDKYKGDAFLIFRGTQLRIDWGTNIDIGTKAISSGLVHAGFYKALGSMKDQIRQFVVIAQAAGIVRFHCIGHSLGSAIATLCGDWLKSSFKINPYIYTFGAPRPGLQNFAKYLSRTFSQDRVFRVHHTGDIVPLIAPWPFVHAPDAKKSCRIEKGGFIPNVASHDRFLYIKSVSDDKGGAIPWKALNKVNERPFSEREIEAWMLMKHERTAVGFTLAFMERVSAAVRHLTVNVLKGLVGGLTMGISSAFTWYDFLAYIFKKGLVATGRVAELIFGLMNKMLRAMGMSVIADVNELTRDKIRHVFLTFNARLNHLVYQAVNHTLAGGKAV